uniref:Uncharacterized protein n=1 Tax=Glossina austeni TaxID=7395 RepID=A0A1A9VAW4_GLOAU
MYDMQFHYQPYFQCCQSSLQFCNSSNPCEYPYQCQFMRPHLYYPTYQCQPQSTHCLPSPASTPPLAGKNASDQYTPAKVSSPAPYESASAVESPPSVTPTLQPSTKPASAPCALAQPSKRSTAPTSPIPGKNTCARHRTAKGMARSTPPLAGKNESIRYASAQVLSPNEPAPTRASRPSLAPATAQTPTRTCVKRTYAVASIPQERPPIKHACVLERASNETMSAPASTLSSAPTSSTSHVSERVSAVNAPKQPSFASSPTQNSSKSTISGISCDENPLRTSSSTSTGVYIWDSYDFNETPAPLTCPYQPPFDSFECTCICCRSEIWRSYFNEQELTDNESYRTDVSCSSSDNDFCYFIPPPPMCGFALVPPPNPIHSPRRK